MTSWTANGRPQDAISNPVHATEFAEWFDCTGELAGNLRIFGVRFIVRAIGFAEPSIEAAEPCADASIAALQSSHLWQGAIR